MIGMKLPSLLVMRRAVDDKAVKKKLLYTCSNIHASNYLRRQQEIIIY
jgi:hypothetical protein